MSDQPRGDRGDVPDFVKDELLEHPLRRGIVETLAETPGMNKLQLCRALDTYPNLVDFHLEQLHDARLVVTRPGAQGNEILCFLWEDAELWENPRTRVLFGRRPIRDVGLYLAENPGTKTRQIAEDLGISPVTVRHHLRTLRDHDLVDRYRAGRRFLYAAGEDLETWASELGSVFERPWDG